MSTENLNQEIEQVEIETVAEAKVKYPDRAKAKKETINNKFLKFLYGLWIGISISCYDFVVSIKKNPSKGAALLIAAPGLFIGFLLTIQTNAIITYQNKFGAAMLFFLMLLSFINIFNATGVSKNKNLKSSIMVSIVTAVLVVCGILYIVDLINGMNNKGFDFGMTILKSFITVIVSLILCTVGTVMSFFFLDKEYTKE